MKTANIRLSTFVALKRAAVVIWYLKLWATGSGENDFHYET